MSIRLEVKGLGEIALVGTTPAIANAVFHATGDAMRLMRPTARLPADWSAQRALLGFR